MYTIQHLKAPNCVNGNPQRLYLVVNTDTERTGAFEEGYAGRHALPEWLWKMATHLPDILISKKEYRRLLKAYPATEY